MKLVRCAKSLARDPRLPRWAKWAMGFAVLPLPGPLDELVGVLVAGVLILRHRALILEHWRAA